MPQEVLEETAADRTVTINLPASYLQADPEEDGILSVTLVSDPCIDTLTLFYLHMPGSHLPATERATWQLQTGLCVPCSAGNAALLVST